MRKLKRVALLLLVPLALSGCNMFGDRVTINSGEVGKQNTTSGLEEAIRQPGSFRMEACMFSACPKLVRLQTAMDSKDVTINTVFLPKSNVDLSDVIFSVQYRVKADKGSVNQAYRDIRAELVSGNEYLISSDMIYRTYIAPFVSEAVIAALREFTVDQALTEPDTISRYIQGEVNKALEGTPVEVTKLSFPNGVGSPPETVMVSKRALYAIDEEKAREIRSLAAQLEVEDQRQAIARKRAENDLQIAGDLGIPVAVYQCLRSMDDFADAAKEGGTTVAYAGNCFGSAADTTFIPLKTED